MEGKALSDTHPRTRTSRRPTREPARIVDAPPSHELAKARPETAREVAALVHLAALDAEILGRGYARRGHPGDAVADERHGLGARLSADVLEGYDRALRAGRHPAVVRLVGSACGGCHVRLHSTLEQKIRRRRGVAPCPHCLRLVYDPGWLAP